MSTNRLVKWSKEAKDFFTFSVTGGDSVSLKDTIKADYNAIVLYNDLKT
jgi:uncharacterized membrane protein